jgi:hypothetical protein
MDVILGSTQQNRKLASTKTTYIATAYIVRIVYMSEFQASNMVAFLCGQGVPKKLLLATKNVTMKAIGSSCLNMEG